MSVRVLSSELQKKAEKELNEVTERIQDDLAHIRSWLSQQHHLNARTDDQWLLNFLRGCKFNYQKTKEKLDMFYTVRTNTPEFFANRDPFLPEIQEILELGIFLPLPRTVDPEGPRIIVARCEPADPKRVSFVTAIKVCLMILDILLNEDDNFVIAGQVGLLDLNGMTIHHMIQATPSTVKKGITFLQDAFPSRPKGFHIVNTPTFFDVIFGLVKAFTKAKILERMYVYRGKDLDQAYAFLPQHILPKEYGGTSSSLDDLTCEWKKKVESYHQWFLEEAKYRTEEKKRAGKTRGFGRGFSLRSSFRKLDID